MSKRRSWKTFAGPVKRVLGVSCLSLLGCGVTAPNAMAYRLRAMTTAEKAQGCAVAEAIWPVLRGMFTAPNPGVDLRLISRGDLLPNANEFDAPYQEQNLRSLGPWINLFGWRGETSAPVGKAPKIALIARWEKIDPLNVLECGSAQLNAAGKAARAFGETSGSTQPLETVVELQFAVPVVSADGAGALAYLEIKHGNDPRPAKLVFNLEKAGREWRIVGQNDVGGPPPIH